MKKRIFFIFAAIAVVLGLPSCSDDGLPADAVVQYPIKTLIVTVDGRDYTAVPKGLRNDTLAFNVPQGRETATVPDDHSGRQPRHGHPLPTGRRSPSSRTHIRSS